MARVHVDQGGPIRTIDGRMDIQIGEGMGSGTEEVRELLFQSSNCRRCLAGLGAKKTVVAERRPSLQRRHLPLVQPLRLGENDHRGPWTQVGHSPERVRISCESGG